MNLQSVEKESKVWVEGRVGADVECALDPVRECCRRKEDDHSPVIR